MPATSPPRREDRVLVRGGRRHHRASYSRTEFRIGVGLLGLLVLIVGWVAWRGAHPDPSLLGTPDALSTPATAPAADRGPLPDGLAAAGWTESPVSTFDSDTLYEKINGREGFYKSLGFRRLWFVSLASQVDPATFVDVEVYDLGEAANALGAYAGERPPGVAPDVGEQGLAHQDRNALYLTRGSIYVRAIGSEESAIVREQLEHLRRVLEAGMAGEPLPWSFALFVGRLGLDPGRVSYVPENAFSFGFARDVHVALLDDETEIFVVAAGAANAKGLAARFAEGFRGYGSAAGRSMGVEWTKDRFIETIAGASHVGPWTIGVRGAPNLKAAEAAFRDLDQAVRDLPEETNP